MEGAERRGGAALVSDVDAVIKGYQPGQNGKMERLRDRQVIPGRRAASATSR